MIDKFKATFLEEANELLSQLEETLLELEENPTDQELLNKAFRAMHTIKGSSSMFGYDEVSAFTHHVENVLDQLRNGAFSIDRDFIGLTLGARDHIRSLLGYESPPAELVETGEDILDKFKAWSGGIADDASAEGEATAETREPAAPLKGGGGEKATWRIAFKPHPGIFKDGTRVLKLIEELAELGESDAYLHMDRIPGLEELDPESCYCNWDIFLTTVKDVNAIRDVFIFVETSADISIERVKEGFGDSKTPKKLGEIFIERGIVSPATVGAVLDEHKKIGEALVEKKVLSKGDVESALLEQEHLKKIQEKKEAAGNSIRVSSDKLDSLVDLVGELVTLQARLSQTALETRETSLSSISEQFERLISQLRDNTMSIRMLPIGSTFNKFKRVVRDLSIELGKEAELVTEGAETELDKTVIEKLSDPLVHIIRNSLDHGIELPALRAEQGKPRSGTVHLAARHSGAYVLIQVSDDGKGLDAEAIRHKAIERGLVAPGQDLGEAEAFELIFAPGFSTAKTVTTVSGRGVGMDVVRREIDSLGGSVQLESRPGKGMTVTLKIPLTLAIIEGLLVRIADEYYVIPLSSVDGCIEFTRKELEEAGERKILHYRDDLVPFASLREFFGTEGETPMISQIVIAQALDSRVGFLVDQVVGDYQTVIKPLGRMYRDIEGLSGATILGDGSVALILDVNRLATVVQREGKGRALARGGER